MAGFRIATPDGIITLQARQLVDGAWKQEVDAAPARRTPIGPPEKITVGTGAVSTLSPPSGAQEAQLFVEAASDIRYYDDGSTPTTGGSGNGADVPAGSALQLDYATFANFKMIAVSQAVVVQVLYYRYGA